MRKVRFEVVFLLVIFLLPYSSLYSQQDSISNFVYKFWQLMDQYSLRYNGERDFVKNYSDKEIDTLTKEYYRAINNDPVGMKLKLGIEFQKWDSVARKIHGLPKELKPGVKLRMTREIIGSKYGENFANIISVPFYLEVEIIGDSSSIYEGLINSRRGYSQRNIIRKGQANLFAIVKEVIKGNKFFKSGQKIIISYLSFWIAEGRKTFEKGKTYFIPLKPWDSPYSHSKLTIDILPDKAFAIYPIIDNKILTPGNYFGIGDSTNWSEFNKEFTKRYILN